MLVQGLQYMFIGMTVVFSFLSIMVVSMHISYQLIQIYNKYFPEEIEKNEVFNTVDEEAEIAVVLAAVKAHSLV